MEVLPRGPWGGEVLREGILPWNRSGGCSRKKHNGRKPCFRFQMEKNLQDTWGKQPDIINVKIQLGAQGAARISSELEAGTPCMEEPGS